MDEQTETEFREFVAVRSGDLMRRAYVLTGGNHQDAQDLVQSALMKAVAHWRRIDDPMAFLRTVMYRQHISAWRRFRRYEIVAAAPIGSESAGSAAPGGTRIGTDTGSTPSADLRLTVRAALFRLSPRQRSVLFLRHFEDLPEADVAAVLGCSIGTVRSTNHRALARLRVVAPELAELYVARSAPEGAVTTLAEVRS